MASKNLRGLSYFAGEGFCGMAHSSSSKKSHQSDSNSDSEDEVRDELPFLREVNEHLGQLFIIVMIFLERPRRWKELRASLKDARNHVTELETQNLDAKLEIDSLKASPMVSDEIYCCDCSVYLANLTALKDKHASTCDELDVVRVEVVELKSKPALLSSCTSYPILPGKIDEMHAYTVLLKPKLKEPIPTSCSTCEVHALKNLELAHYVNRWQDENDELRKIMGWLSGLEPQLRMTMETYKRYDGQALGSEKVGECSAEGGEKIGDIQAPPKTFHKNAYAPKPNPLRLGMRVRSLVRRNRLRSRVKRNQVSSPIPSLNISLCGFIVTIVGEMVTRASFASRRSVRREWKRSGLTRTSPILPMIYLSLVCRCLGPRRL
jgi:hypothetical protein